MSFFGRIRDFLSPEPEDNNTSGLAAEAGRPQGINPEEVTVNEILNTLFRHFISTIEKLTTDHNFLYHTSFTIYLKAANYSEISDSFPFMAQGAEKMLVDEIKKRTKNRYPGYSPHSQYWQFQLVEIPEDAEIDGVSEDDMQNGIVIQIQSTLFPPSEGNKESSRGTGRVVTTVQGVNSLRAIRNCINPEILNKLYLIEKDRVKLKLTLDDSKPAGPRPSQTGNGFKNKPETAGGPGVRTASMQPAPYHAILEAQDGEFLDGNDNSVIHTMAVTADEVHISGRSAMRGSDGVEVIRVNSDRILSPHVKIRRNPSAGTFQICVIGPTTLNMRTMECNPSSWVMLPRKSTIILDDEVQIKFTATD